MSTNRYFSLYVSQAGSAISGFCTEEVVTKLQLAVREFQPFMLNMKNPRGYSAILVNPTVGGLTIRCNIAQDGDAHWEAVPVDAEGNIVDPSQAAKQLLPAEAKGFHITFLDPTAARPPAAGNTPPPESLPSMG